MRFVITVITFKYKNGFHVTDNFEMSQHFSDGNGHRSQNIT